MSDQPSPKRKTLGLKSAAASAAAGAARKSGANRPVRVSDLNRRRVQTVAEGVRAAQQRADASGKPRKTGGARPAPDARTARRPGGEERGPRRFGDDERGPRRFGDDERAPRRTGGDERGPRRFGTEERPPRRFGTDERPPRRTGGDERGPRRFGTEERPPRGLGADERPPRRTGGDERPRRFGGDEPRERQARSGQPSERRERAERGDRPTTGARREYGSDRGARPARGERSEYAPRRTTAPRTAEADSPERPARPRRPQGEAGEVRPARSGFGAGTGRAPKPGNARSRDNVPPAAQTHHALRSPARPPSSTHAAGAVHGDDGLVRLSKRMSELGLCSRREADEWIPRGWVLVDGKPVTELGTRIRPDATIEIQQAARSEQGERVTVLLHKPVGYVSGQAEEGYQPAATLFTAENQWENDPTRKRYAPWQHKGLAPAGRLDIDSTGLLVLTQDGRIAKQLIGEDSNIEKEYLVRVVWEDAPDGPVERNISAVFPAERLDKLRHGLSLDGEPLKPAKVSWQNEEQLRFVLREGKKRQIRRMCEQVGLRVVGLKRVRMGRIVLGDLPVGQWRFLGPFEKF